MAQRQGETSNQSPNGKFFSNRPKSNSEAGCSVVFDDKNEMAQHQGEVSNQSDDLFTVLTEWEEILRTIPQYSAGENPPPD